VLTDEEIKFIMVVLSRGRYGGTPQEMADYLAMYSQVMNKLDSMLKSPIPPDEVEQSEFPWSEG